MNTTLQASFRPLLCALAMVFCEIVNAQPLPLVAVIPLESRLAVDAGESSLLSDALASELHGTGRLRVMERAQMDNILAEQGFQHSGACVGGECAVEIGQILGIDRMVVGSFGKLGRTWTLNIRIVDVATGEVMASATRNQQGEIDDVLTRLIPEVARQIVGMGAASAAEPPVAAAPPEPLRPSAPVSPPAPEVAQKRGTSWLWWLGGAALVGGGAAVVLLTSSPDAPDGPSRELEVRWAPAP